VTHSWESRSIRDGEIFKLLCDKEYPMRKLFQALKRDERGVTALEYVILAVVVVGAVTIGGAVLRNVITSAFSQVGSTISSCLNSPSSCG
jgi:Flp pilus assembly pilin Flp